MDCELVDAKGFLLGHELEYLLSWPLELDPLQVHLVAKQFRLDEAERVLRLFVHVSIRSQYLSKFLLLLAHELLDLQLHFVRVLPRLLKVVLPYGDVCPEHLVELLCLKRAHALNVVDESSREDTLS